MYHEVPRSKSDAGYFAVPKDRFAAHLDLLRSLGRNVVSLETALRSGAGDARSVALTFDDGHHTHYGEAFPLLVERGMSATFFVTTSWVGKQGYVTWDQLSEMASAGMSIQSHTATHPFLSELRRDDAERELLLSKTEIERHTGRPCSTLALPGGDEPCGWRASDYAKVGYQCVATSSWGPNSGVPPPPGGPAMFVRRYTVRRETPDSLLQRQALALEPAFGVEGLRLAVLHTLRSTLGATRYTAWRRRAFRLLARE